MSDEWVFIVISVEFIQTIEGKESYDFTTFFMLLEARYTSVKTNKDFSVLRLEYCIH